MFQRSPLVEPKTIERRTARPNGANGTQAHLSAASSGEKSVIGNDLKIIGQGLKIIGRGTLQVDGEIEGDVQAVEVVVGERGKVTGMVAGQQVGHGIVPATPPENVARLVELVRTGTQR